MALVDEQHAVDTHCLPSRQLLNKKKKKGRRNTPVVSPTHKYTLNRWSDTHCTNMKSCQVHKHAYRTQTHNHETCTCPSELVCQRKLITNNIQHLFTATRIILLILYHQYAAVARTRSINFVFILIRRNASTHFSVRSPRSSPISVSVSIYLALRISHPHLVLPIG